MESDLRSPDALQELIQRLGLRKLEEKRLRAVALGAGAGQDALRAPLLADAAPPLAAHDAEARRFDELRSMPLADLRAMCVAQGSDRS